VRISDAENGARIKCWAGSGVGSGIVKNITFENFVVDAVDNPVVIDQVSLPLLLETYSGLIQL
jgi:galacturan 1,4-alpha-galacturonidase